MVNFAPNQSQCYVQVPGDYVDGQTVRLRDRMSSEQYERDVEDLRTRGLYLDLPPWGYHVFELERM